MIMSRSEIVEVNIYNFSSSGFWKENKIAIETRQLAQSVISV